MSISGKKMEAKIGGVSPVFIAGNYAWDASGDVAELGSTTAEDQGFGNRDAGVRNCTVNLKMYMDVALGEFTPVIEGTVITNLKLYRDKDDTVPAFVFPVALVVNARQGGEVEGKIECAATVKNKGSFTYNDP